MSLDFEDLFDGTGYDVGEPIDGLDGGSGWYAEWMIQADATAGYLVEAPLTYPGLLGSGTGGSMHGGDLFQTGGRTLYAAPAQPAIFYFAFLLTREASNADFVAALHDGSFPETFYLATPIGASLAGGNICLRLGATDTSTGVAFATDTTFLAVLKLEYTAGDVVASLFINPPLEEEPETPDATDTATHAGIRQFTASLGWYTDANRGANIGCIRGGTTWADVLPPAAPPPSYGVAIESDEALAPGGAKFAPVGLATETDTALELSPPADIGPSVSAACWFTSGHSLLEGIGELVADLADDATLTQDWQNQNIVGSPISVRTKGSGAHPGTPPWNGYADGANRTGSELDLIEHFRAVAADNGKVTTALYTDWICVERHDYYSVVQWEGTIQYARHQYELIREGSPSCRGYLYAAWLDYDNVTRTEWIQHMREMQLATAALASRINLSLAYESRSDRVASVPSALGLANLLEASIAGDGLDGITVFDGESIDEDATQAVIFADAVHPTDLGTYFLSLIVYATIYRRNPTGLAYPVGVTSTQAASLQAVAWSTITEYFDGAYDGPTYDQAELKSAFIDALELQLQIRDESSQLASLTAYHSGTSTPLHFDEETDSGFWFAAPSGAAIPYGISLESDAALAAGGFKSGQHGLAAESGAALAPDGTKAADYGVSEETDSALALIGEVAGLSDDFSGATLHPKWTVYDPAEALAQPVDIVEYDVRYVRMVTAAGVDMSASQNNAPAIFQPIENSGVDLTITLGDGPYVIGMGFGLIIADSLSNPQNFVTAAVGAGDFGDPATYLHRRVTDGVGSWFEETPTEGSVYQIRLRREQNESTWDYFVSYNIEIDDEFAWTDEELLGSWDLPMAAVGLYVAFWDDPYEFGEFDPTAANFIGIETAFVSPTLPVPTLTWTHEPGLTLSWTQEA